MKQLFIVGVFIFFQGCSDVQDKFSENNNSKLSSELKNEILDDYLYKIGDTKYYIDSLPLMYTKVSQEEKLLFLDKYLKYKIILESLKVEQKKYKKLIKETIEEETNEFKRKGTFPNDLNKNILFKKISVETIGQELIAEEDKNLTKEIKDFYKKNKKFYSYPKEIEISLIVSQDKEELISVLTKLKKDKVTIKRFSQFSTLYSKDKKLRKNGGYFGKINSKNFTEKKFSFLWDNSPNYGLLDKIIEKDNYFLLFFILDKKQPFITTFNNEKKNIRNYILSQKLNKNKWVKRSIKELLKGKKIKIRTNLP